MIQLVPGRIWRWLRRCSQGIALAAIIVGPVLGGWQRLDRAELALWDDRGWNLPEWIRDPLTLGNDAGYAYDALVLLGGGSAAQYAGMPAIDPVAGVAALLRVQVSPRFVLALGITVLVAMLGGRLFCGWLCPFGVMARSLETVRAVLPWRRYAIPRWRPLRWLLLMGSIGASVLGVHWVLFLVLPHLIVQQSIYAMWLLGGGGVICGVLLGLIGAGLVLGPTVYCAALCPTGAMLSLLGRKKIVRLAVAQPSACGRHCARCDGACWLQLHPAAGNPGPDCDSCGRCIVACPRANLRVVIGRPGSHRAGPPGGTSANPSGGKQLLRCGCAAAILALAAGAPGAAAAQSMTKPHLLLTGEMRRGDVTVAVALVDQHGVTLDPDSRHALSGVELSAYLGGGKRGFYRGPLVIRVGTEVVRFAEPSAPRSTPTRSIYRRILPMRPGPGLRVVVEPVPGWLAQPATWQIPHPGAARSGRVMFEVALGAALGFAGLLYLALAIPGVPWLARAGRSATQTPRGADDRDSAAGV